MVDRSTLYAPPEGELLHALRAAGTPLAAALALLRRDIPVQPIRIRSGGPTGSIVLPGPAAEHQATEQWPDGCGLGVGIPTGPETGIVGIRVGDADDLDDRLREYVGDVLVTLRAARARNGRPGYDTALFRVAHPRGMPDGGMTPLPSGGTVTVLWDGMAAAAWPLDGHATLMHDDRIGIGEAPDRLVTALRIGRELRSALACWPPESIEEIETPAVPQHEDGPDLNAPRPKTPADVIEALRRRGPLVHEPTGIDWIDERTGGGLPYGTRCVIVGAPDSGKTSLTLEIGDNLGRRGIPVGILAIDEEPEDMLCRFAQRRGITREQFERCERLDDLDELLRTTPIQFYGADWTIDRAAADLKRRYGRPGALIVDSIQTATTTGEAETGSMHQQIGARMHALRDAASQFGHIAIATSEMSRAHFANKRQAADMNAMAAGSGSSAIEYQARVVIALHSEGNGVVKLSMPKNKLGRGGGEAETFLRLDRETQTWEPAIGHVPRDADAERAEKVEKQALRDAAAVAEILIEQDGAGSRVLEREGQRRGISKARVGIALEALGQAVDVHRGDRNARLHYLRAQQLDPEIADLLSEDARALIGHSSQCPSVPQCPDSRPGTLAE